MAKPMKGVSCVTKGSTEYWYARIDGQKKYCGKGDKGREIAIAAKAKQIAKNYENKEISAGLKVKKVKFKTVTDLSNWYMQLPTTQKLSSYQSESVLSSVKILWQKAGKRVGSR